ncbi:sensor histidine kinase [Bradyrhizobium sp. WD16]|uniref:sensor histidine kinase n=1 Tax=Bradyrhizobium sp. WD16 TaxID=1521768 RepID=UPI0020A37A76|nr:histidine kinase [Bradyrhizobium sp. WD16]
MSQEHAMPTPRLDLKLRLALRVAAMAALCFTAAAAYVVFETSRSARARADWMADLAARDLSLQTGQNSWIKSGLVSFPDLQPIAAVVMAPGLCIAYRDRGGDLRQRLCSGADPADTAAPWLFAALYRRLLDADVQAVRPVPLRGEAKGEVVVSTDPQSLIGQSWRETSRLVAVMAGTLLGLCVLVYAALASALRPTRTIRAGLERLAAGDLSARLPPLDLAELSAVGDVFNHLAGSLETTLAERNALTRRLIEVQDEERRHLARELHDEFGQCLAAIGAVAASAAQTAHDSCPALVPECRSIARTAAHMMEVLRGALLRLRPPDVEELGLAASLEGLVAGWNSRAGGRTRFSIELEGRFDRLPGEFAASLYRIAQEAITNAAKHAQASNVVVRLRMQEPPPPDRPHCIELAVADDGKADGDLSMKAGLGLLGMRERIGALGGRLDFEVLHPGGLVLRAQIPVPPAAVDPDLAMAAA